MAVLQAAISRPTKCSFEREAINQIEFLPHDDAGSRLSRLLHLKVAGLEFEILVVLAEKQREDSLFQPVAFRVGTTVHEQVLRS